MLLEQWALKKKDEVFREVFGMSVTLATGKEMHESQSPPWTSTKRVCTSTGS